ncbi:MAG TPA: hypothetical protein VM307_05450, partial [Egibacteraceae bacterium]|nr:hypothetical protein [Egibacteraceae bacterium]
MDKDAWKKYIDTASGLTEVTRKGAERVVRALVKQGEIAADQVERTVDDLLKRSEKNRKAVAAIVRTEVERTVSRLGLAKEKDVDRLESKVSRLESSGPAASTAKKTARKAAKKSAADRRAAAAATSTASRSTSAGSSATTAKKS